MSDSVRPHRRQPTRLPCPWDSPGKNTGVSCHFLLQCVKVKSESEITQSCPTLRDPVDCSLPGFSIHGISRQEYWSGLPFPSPGDLPDPGKITWRRKSESEVAQSCLTLSDPMDCSLPGSSIHGISRQEYWSGVPLPSPALISVVGKSRSEEHTSELQSHHCIAYAVSLNTKDYTSTYTVSATIAIVISVFG